MAHYLAGSSAMGFRIRRSVKIIPGVRLNLSGSGLSVSLGTTGIRYTLGNKGSRVTIGIPGTGLSWTKYSVYSGQEEESKAVAKNEQLDLHVPLTTLTTEITSASAKTINAKSISELAPSLNLVQDRIRLTPFTLLLPIPIAVLAAIISRTDVAIIGFCYCASLMIGAIFCDHYRRSIRVKFEYEGVAKTILETLTKTFSDIQISQRIWAVTSSQHVFDKKRNAGASTLNTRSAINLTLDQPRSIRGSMRFPTIKTQSQQLYFLPDAILVVTGSTTAALAYQELSFQNNPISFIETDSVPKDAIVIGYRWKFVNKDGSPDRRFNFNRKIPICQYGEMAFSSRSGLNCILQYSNISSADRFCKAIEILQRPTSRIDTKPITKVQIPSVWPGRIFLSAGLGLAAAYLLIAAKFYPSPITIEPKAIDIPYVSPPSQSQRNTQHEPRIPPTKKEPMKLNETKQTSQTQSVISPSGPIPRTIGECLIIQDMDLRSDCFEQVYATNPTLK